MITTPQTKTCSKCKQEKNLNEFRNQQKGKYGKKNYCRICDDENGRALYQKNQLFRTLQVEEWNRKNPDKVKQYQKNWTEKSKMDK